MAFPASTRRAEALVRRALLLLCAVWLPAACVTTGAGNPPVELRSDHEEVALSTVVHVVEPGQNLYRIAKAYGLPPEEIAGFNGIDDVKSLSVGQRLTIPGAIEKRRVEMADGNDPPEASKPPVKKVSRDDKWRPPDPKGATPASKPEEIARRFAWPLRGVLYARFGKKGREPHDGIDLAAPEGTSVKTAAAGTVLYAGEQKGYGLIAIVDHGDGFITLYAHNRDLRVKTGQKLRDAQVVATVGQSGSTSGPHLHFEIRQNGKPVDPLPLLGPPPSSASARNE